MIEWLPGVRAEVVSVALPATSEPVPSVVAPFLNVTVPVAVPTVDVTVAVNVTSEPKTDGFLDEPTEVVVAPLMVKLTVLVVSTLPALSVLWNVTVLLPRFATLNGAVYVCTAPPLI